MRIAIIDLGTNSVRFDVHSISANGKSKILHREKLMVRLGQGVFLHGRIEEAVVERTLQALRRFQRVAVGLRARKVLAFGTSALREAQNSQAFIDAVKENTGLEIVVISGKEEAKLIALGVLNHERAPKGSFALLDIGGGSTEVSVCRGKKVMSAESFPLGTARLQQVFLKSIPPRKAAVAQLRDYIRQVVGGKIAAEGWAKAPAMIGSSGTVRAIAKILGAKKEFSLRDLSSLVREMQGMNVSELMDMEGMEPKRVDMILAGALILEEVCRLLGTSKIKPTDFSLRDGIFEEQRKLAASHASSIEFHREDIFARAVRLGEAEEHVRSLADLTENIFARLRGLHRLDRRWEAYLMAAMVLRNCGELVGFNGKEKHSYYLVKHSDLPGLEPWEHEFIAQLCRHYAGGKVSAKDLASFGKDRRRKEAFPKLLALLRLLDALDPGPSARLKLRRVQLSRRQVAITFGGENVAGVEHLLTDRKKKLFEEAFGRQLLVKRSK